MELKKVSLNPKFLRGSIIFVTLLVLGGLIWMIYTKDEPKIIPPETRGEVREAVKEEIAKPIESVWPGGGTPISNAAFDAGTSLTNAGSDGSSTANWQPYKNAQYGFEFKYPENYVLKEGNNYVKVWDKKYGNNQSTFPTIRIEAYDNPTGLGVNEWLDKYPNNIIGEQPISDVPAYNIRKSVTYLLSGLEMNLPGMGTDKITILNKGNKIYVIEGLPDGNFDPNSDFGTTYYGLLGELK